MSKNMLPFHPDTISLYRTLPGVDELRERLNGNIPFEDMNGQSFYVNIRDMEHQPRSFEDRVGICLNMQANLGTSKLPITFCCNPTIKSETQCNCNKGNLSNGIVMMVKLPDLYSLNPIGIAGYDHQRPTHYLSTHVLVVHRVNDIKAQKNSIQLAHFMVDIPHGEGLRT
ncbi:hypothetical protein HB364_13750 [Pseudoflavitalea sp. X16]|uniref:hypothetical protein n=1 Tax=Paraflavitalea devenefica TaxID=2716334 RepID=UPI00142393BF|nr:hypothetical protein [Paraflavitalea devenefica]NII26152.1 hypothetical protein [Paraflavitalea devenefica]